MTQDRELLEQAAKAAGIAGNLRQFQMPYSNATHIGIGKNRWNPLESDADALRLAVNLCLVINIGEMSATVYGQFDSEIGTIFGDDPYAATRRAIVRAAAEIGKDMK